MKINQYIKLCGIERILDECNNNLREVKAHLRRECDIPEDYDFSYTMRIFKNSLDKIYNSSHAKELIAEVLQQLQGETL